MQSYPALQCQVQLLPIYSELIDPEMRRISKVIDRSIAVDVLIYLTVAAVGYLSDFNNTATLVLEREVDKPPDYAALVAIVGVIFSVIQSIPLSFNPARSQIIDMLYGDAEMT